MSERLDGARSDGMTACFKTILVAVDGSAVSNFGLEEVILMM
jgi:hypothetical protein